MLSLMESKKWKRVNSSIMINSDNTKWRTVSHGLRESITAEGKRTYVLPRIIRIQGRGANISFNNVGCIVNDDMCEECKIGIIKINKHLEHQCNICGLIYDDKYFVDNYKDMVSKKLDESIDYNNSSWDEMNLEWKVNNSKEAKVLNERYKRIKEFENRKKSRK